MAHWRGVLVGIALVVGVIVVAFTTYLATKRSAALADDMAVATPTWSCQDSYKVATGASTGNFTLHLCTFGPLRTLRIIADTTISKHAFILFAASTIADDDLPAFDAEKDGPIHTLTGYLDTGSNATAPVAIQVAFNIFDDGSAMIGTTQFGAKGLEAISVTEFATSLNGLAFQGITTTLTWMATFDNGPPLTVAPIVVGLGNNGTKLSKAEKYALASQ